MGCLFYFATLPPFLFCLDLYSRLAQAKEKIPAVGWQTIEFRPGPFYHNAKHALNTPDFNAEMKGVPCEGFQELDII